MHGRPWWHQRFHNFGSRVTQPREVILEILENSNDHLSAADIYIQAHEANPSIGLTTVYRTLDMLTHMGIVQKFDFGDGRARFELTSHEGKGHHHHLVCLQCKKIIDYSDMMEEEKKFLTRIEQQLAKKYNFSIMDHLIRFNGICGDCRAKKG